jgi:phosphatidate cytidylyltransferase
LVLNLVFDFTVDYFYATVYGIAGSAACIVGDLSFSVMKRQAGIKDYGNLLPGHGGVLDRFDSMTLVAPVIEALLIWIPLIVK